MRIPKRLKLAINTYYAHRTQVFEGGICFPNGRIKDECCKAVDRVATEFGFGLCITAGTFFLSKGSKSVQLSKPFPPADLFPAKAQNA